VVTANACGVAAIEVVGAEVVVGDAVLEHVPEGYDHRVLHGHDGLLRAAPPFEPVVERAVITLLMLIGLTPNATMDSVARWAGLTSPSL